MIFLEAFYGFALSLLTVFVSTFRVLSICMCDDASFLWWIYQGRMDVLILVVVCDGSILGAMPSSCFGYAVSGSSTRIWGFGSLHLARRYDCQKLSLHHPQGFRFCVF